MLKDLWACIFTRKFYERHSGFERGQFGSKNSFKRSTKIVSLYLNLLKFFSSRYNKTSCLKITSKFIWCWTLPVIDPNVPYSENPNVETLIASSKEFSRWKKIIHSHGFFKKDMKNKFYERQFRRKTLSDYIYRKTLFCNG